MSENESNEDEPEIIVDTDWKEQVARERDAATDDSSDSDQAAKPTEPMPTATEETVNDDAGEVSDAPSASGDGMPEPPPASFSVLISMLFTQAMAMLGQMPDENTGEVTVNKSFAKHYIDTLEMLEEKTKGNLEDDESAMLSEALHALRMMYVNAQG
ncbi:MAG: DUF1844 domain-containing protein [Rubripirellula sp.]